MPFVVVTELACKPEHLGAARAAMQTVAVAARDASACDMYGLHVVADGAPRLITYQRWRDRPAYDRFHATAETRLAMDPMREWLAGAVQVTELMDVL